MCAEVPIYQQMLETMRAVNILVRYNAYFFSTYDMQRSADGLQIDNNNDNRLSDLTHLK